MTYPKYFATPRKPPGVYQQHFTNLSRSPVVIIKQILHREKLMQNVKVRLNLNKIPN